MKKDSMFGREKYILLILFGVILLVIFTSTYAFKPELTPNSMLTQVLRLDEEAYGETEFDASELEFRPILDDTVDMDSDQVIYIPFTVGGADVNNVEKVVYDIALADLEVDCNLLSPYMKWKLFKNGELMSEGSLDYKFDTIVNGRLVLTPIQQDLVKYNENKSAYDKYEFYMWLSDSCQSEDITECVDSVDQSNMAGKRIKGRIEVELYAEFKKELVRKPSDTLNIKTCLNGIVYEGDILDEQENAVANIVDSKEEDSVVDSNEIKEINGVTEVEGGE